jgi:hypothetical protein
VLIVLKSGSLNLLETSGLAKARNGICFTFTFTSALHFFDKQTQVAEIIFKNAQGIERKKERKGGMR